MGVVVQRHSREVDEVEKALGGFPNSSFRGNVEQSQRPADDGLDGLARVLRSIGVLEAIID